MERHVAPPTDRRVSAWRGGGPGARVAADIGTLALRRCELERARDLLAHLGQHGAAETQPRSHSAEHGGREPGRTGSIEQQDDLTARGQHRPDGGQRAAQGGHIPAPLSTGRGTEDGLQRQRLGSLPAQHDRGGEIREGQVLGTPVHGWLRQYEAHPRSPVPSGGQGLPALGQGRADARHRCASVAQDDIAGTFHERRQVGTQTCLDRARRCSLQPLDEGTNLARPLLEEQPRVPLAPAALSGEAQPPGAEPEGGRSAEMTVEPAGREQHVRERQSQGGLDRCRPQVRVDPFGEGGDRLERPGRIEVQQLIGKLMARLGHREPRAQRLAAG